MNNKPHPYLFVVAVCVFAMGVMIILSGIAQVLVRGAHG